MRIPLPIPAVPIDDASAFVTVATEDGESRWERGGPEGEDAPASRKDHDTALSEGWGRLLSYGTEACHPLAMTGGG